MTVYTPNSQSELARLSYRMQWETDFLAYLKGLEQKKPVIFAGDLNVAYAEIDLKNPKTNWKNAGFTDEERAKFGEVLVSVLSTHSAIFIRRWKEFTLGGHIDSVQEQRTPAGESTISVCQRV